jgi:ParB-like chromosome segregation protein Spo0J
MLPLLTKPLTFLRVEQSQGKRHAGTDAHRRLTESVRQHGILQAPGARPDGCVVWGTGRVLAAIEAGLKEISVVILDKPMTEAQYRVLTLTENFIRTELKPSEQVDGIEELARLNPELSNQAIADLLALDPSMVTRLRSVANCPIARSALAEGKLTGISDAYAVAKATPEQKTRLLELKLSGATRDQLEQAGRAGRKTGGPVSAVKLSRIRCPIPGGPTIVASGMEMTLEGFIQALQASLELAKRALKESLDAKTAERVWKQRAKAGR